MLGDRVDRNDMLSFERAKLRNEMTRQRQENAEKLRRERMLLKDQLEEKKLARKKYKEKRKTKAKRTKVFRSLMPKLPRKKKQNKVISRRKRIGLL